MNGSRKDAEGKPKAAGSAARASARFGMIHTLLYAGALYAALLGFSLVAPLARADTNHPQCDNLNGGTGGGARAAELLCGSGTLGEELTLYGIEMQVANNTGGPYYVWTDDANASDPQYTGTVVPSGTGFSTYYFATPREFSTGSRPIVFVSASSTASVGSSPGFTTHGYAAPTNSQYQRYLFSPETPDDEGDGTTHVIRITEPEYGEIVASTTIPVSFDFIVSSTSPANAYEISARRLLDPYGITYARGFLVDEGWDTSLYDIAFTINSEITVPNEGSYELKISLIEQSPDIASAPIVAISPAKLTLFSAVIEDLAPPGSVPGRTIAVFDAESCDLNLNPFEESTFNFGDCMGYLLSPGPEVWSKYQTLTLADRFPFSYISQLGPIKDAIYGNSNTSPSNISVNIEGFGEIIFLSRDAVAAVPFAPLIKEMLSAVLWFFLAYSLYRIVIRSHDTQTHV